LELKCPVCSEECKDFADHKHYTGYYYCSNCQLIFKSPENFQDFTEQKKRYDLHQNDEDNEGYQAYFKRFLDFVLPKTECVDLALDFGCGASSLLAKMLAEEGIVCDSYDPIYYPEKTYLNRSYDLIVSVEVFEHIHHPRETFGHLLSKLKRGGYLAIRTEFHSNEIEDFLNWYYRLDPTHIVFYTPETFRCLCDEYGALYKMDNGKNILLIQKK